MTRKFESPDEDTDKIRLVREVYDAHNLGEKCHELIDQYVDSAIAHLEQANITPAAREFFISIAEESRTRTH